MPSLRCYVRDFCTKKKSFKKATKDRSIGRSSNMTMYADSNELFEKAANCGKAIVLDEYSYISSICVCKLYQNARKVSTLVTTLWYAWLEITPWVWARRTTTIVKHLQTWRKDWRKRATQKMSGLIAHLPIVCMADESGINGRIKNNFWRSAYDSEILGGSNEPCAKDSELLNIQFCSMWDVPEIAQLKSCNNSNCQKLGFTPYVQVDN